MSISALSIAVSALRTHAYALETTSHNVANASTGGYRRQRVDLKTAAPRQSALGAMGSGVTASGISRATDALADLRARGAGAEASYFGTRNTIAADAEQAFGEPDHGVTTALAQTWQAFSTLALTPADAAARHQVLSALDNLASRVNDVRASLDALSADALTRLGNEVTTANEIAVRLAEINRFARQPGGLPPDLADERDLLLDNLSSSIGARSEIQTDGRVRVTVGGLAIVDAERASALTIAAGPPTSVAHPSGPATLGGIAGGLLAAMNGDLPSFRAQLDTFVTSLTTAFNTTHATGFTPGGAPGGGLLTEIAGQLTVVPTAPADLAAAGVSGAEQDGSVAEALAALRDTQGQDYRAVVTELSATVAGLARSADTAQSVADSARQSRDSIVGVNLDEEMTNLVAQQRAYESAAKVISIVDEMLQTLIMM